MKSYKKILLFGGVFDPIHIGHTKILKKAIDKIKPDITYVVPNKIPPLKSSLPISNDFERVKMIELAISGMKKVEVCNYEIESNSFYKSYTFLLLRYFKKLYPDAKLYFLIGYDRYLDFKKWEKHEEISSSCTLVVANRNGNCNKKVDNVIFINVPEVKISSHELRNKLNPAFLDKKVLEYIVSRGIYLKQQIKPLMSNYRFNHSIRVALTAHEFAKKYNSIKLSKQAKVAALCHDIAKEFSQEKLLSIVGKNYNKKLYPTIHTTHGLAASIFVQKEFLIKDKVILSAIKNHVIPPKNASVLDKIIYCADKLEPARTNKDIPKRKELYELACNNIDKAFKTVLKFNEEKYKK